MELPRSLWWWRWQWDPRGDSPQEGCAFSAGEAAGLLVPSLLMGEMWRLEISDNLGTEPIH